MSILIDTNVMLDIALRREPFFQTSALALAKARRAGPTHLCAISVTTLHYFLRKSLGESGARAFLGVAEVTQNTLALALPSAMRDFEDAVIAHAAFQGKLKLILTRNPADFVQSPVQAVTPDAYLNLP